MKIDVEGAESEAVAGMRETLRSRRPLVICEVLHSSSSGQVEHQRSKNRTLYDLLRALDYRVLQIVKSKPPRLKTVPEFNWGIFDWKSYEVCDYLFVPEERVSATLEAFDSTS